MPNVDPAFIAASSVPLAFATVALIKLPAVYLLGLHIISRVVLDSASEFTYAKLPGGLSLMQLYSVAFIGVAGLYVFLNRGTVWHRYTAPLMAICAVHLISTLINASWMGLITALLRWAYLWVLIALTLRCLEQGSEKGVMVSVCIAGVYTFLNQMWSVVTDSPKWGAGQWSFVGTYAHESDISFLFLFLTPAALYFISVNRGRVLQTVGAACLLSTGVGMYLAAYRSLWVALAGYWGLYLWNRYLRGNISSRAVWMAGSIAAASLLVSTLGPIVAEKMADLGVFLANPGRYLDFSGEAESVALMSGRIDLINSYMGIYLTSGPHVWLAGIGPESGSEVVGLYAHNEYLSALVETGVLGLLALLWLLARSAGFSLALATSTYAGAQVAAPFIVVVVVSALGTMPFRDMRGMLAIGLMFAFTAFYQSRRELASKEKLQSDVPHTLLMPQGPKVLT